MSSPQPSAPARLASHVIPAGGPTDLAGVVEVLAGGYADTALGRWLVPDPQQRTDVLRRYLDVDLRYVPAPPPHLGPWRFTGMVDILTGPRRSAAVWRRLRPSESWPVGDNHDTRLEAACGTTHAARFVALDATLTRVLDQPHRPSVCLALVAAAPDQQRRGHASVLLAHQHWLLDRSRLPAQAIASDPAVAGLLHRHGYRPHGPTLPVAGGGPYLQPTLRDRAGSH